jgi:hypothetical protein
MVNLMLHHRRFILLADEDGIRLAVDGHGTTYRTL